MYHYQAEVFCHVLSKKTKVKALWTSPIRNCYPGTNRVISFWKKAERYGVIHLYKSSLGFLVLAALWVEQLSDSVFSSIASQQEGPGFELYNYLTMGLKGGDRHAAWCTHAAVVLDRGTSISTGLPHSACNPLKSNVWSPLRSIKSNMARPTCTHKTTFL